MSLAGIVAIRNHNNFRLVSPVLSSELDDSIYIYLAMSGSMVPMRVLRSESVESVKVKIKIKSNKGFRAKVQKLVCKGRELAREYALLRDYGVEEGNVLHLMIRLAELQVVSVRTSCGEEFSLLVKRKRNVAYVKRRIAKKYMKLANVNEQEVFYGGEKLDDQRLIYDISKYYDAVIHLFVQRSAQIRSTPREKNFEVSIVAQQLHDTRNFHEEVRRKTSERDVLLEPVVTNPKVELSSAIQDMIKSTAEGLDSGKCPIRSSEGTGGAYLMQNSRGSKYLSVFKPIDEEPMAVNNPQGLPLSENGEGLKKGTSVGEGALREVAAYVLDHPKSGRRSFCGEKNGFSGVPPTVMAKCRHMGFNHRENIDTKTGSLQMFMENNGSCEDMGPSSFPVEEVHKISVLDIRMANTDRHAGNILLSKDEDGKTILIPIDHGYCLPKSFEDCTFDWLYWPQTRKPYSRDTIEYIKSLDAEEDVALLKFHGWDLPQEYARTLRISTMLLKKGVERGLTPFDIGNIMCRETLNKKSIIEEIVQEAEDSVLPCTSEATFLESISQFMDRRLDEITK
ncbi:1-phosphatidylinositol 4-kinase [Heracleum sosnowskyi]|uniref:1-phosphatidylinositol 4-kinase n=1 Tax=Heracleum sosnowskyi TaxID=360622 RepID=A0AAD8HDB6_9APIA|nr:1-phosphatidylinositol 4-kinase [Heracleum sosnowskyi]